MNKKNILFFILLFGILSFSFISAYSSSVVQLSQYGISTREMEKYSCDEGSDFIMQIEPFGCTPAVVTSDLLEESNVPVFCKLAVTKINPLVEVNAIESVSITGNLSKDVSGVAYYPAKSALNTGTTLTSSVLENIGYVVINLKKHPNSSSMPDLISGDLTATIRYDVDDALGLGDGVFYIPELNDEDWEARKGLYQFWGGKGFLKVDSIDDDEATISLYQGQNKLSSVTLEKGETSNNIYIPGVECSAGVKLKLVDLDNPTTRAELRINSEVVEVAEGEKFLDNKCSVRDIEKNGLVQKVSIRCKEDEGTNTFDLIISPKVLLNVNGEDKKVGIGEYLYNDENGNGVYLAYVGTKGDSTKIEDAFVYLVSMPKKSSGNLSESDISSFNFVVGDLITAQQENAGIIESLTDALKQFAGLSNRLSRIFGLNQKLYRINFGTTENAFGKQITFVNYAGSTDGEMKPEYQEEYDAAKLSYEIIREQYSSESFSGTLSYGEEALYSEISLAYSANQKNFAAELCAIAEEQYPDSIFLPTQCKYVYKLSSDASDEYNVEINNKVKTISLDGIYEPTFDEYGVDVTVVNSTGSVKEYPLRKGQIVYLNTEGGDYMQLVSADDGSAKIKTSISVGGVMDAIKKEFGSDNLNLETDVTKDLGGYSFTLNNVHLKKSAKVAMTSTINSAGTKANFSFRVGIEQRAIKLSPEEIKDKLDDLNKTIEKWEGVSNEMGGVIKTLKTTCLATGVVLITKNFIAGLGNAGTARQYVMRGNDGWFEKCSDMVNAGEYSSTDQCLSEHSSEINKDVNTVTNIINNQNSQIENLEKGVTTSKFLSDDIVDSDAFMQKYTTQVANDLSGNSALGTTITDPTGKGEAIQTSEVIDTLTYDSWKNNYYSTEELRNIELYSSVLKSPTASDELKAIAKAELYSELSDVMIASQDAASRQRMADETGVEVSKITVLETGKDVKKLSYSGLTLEQIGGCVTGLCVSGVGVSTPVAVVQTYPNGKKYILLLENSPGTSKYYIKTFENTVLHIYDYDSFTLTTAPELLNVYFEKYDSASYENEYKNPEVSYYETEPYKGLPAVVPFDIKKGWYAATKQTVAVGGNIQTYDASGKVNSFFLCNVGANGMEEFYSKGYGDDTCILINTGTGQPYSQVPGLDETQAKKLVTCAIEAIRQAAEAYPATGKVKISTSCASVTVNVGKPSANIPEFACQDFMSPDECLLLFNVCDPVICPSSRCDFGGTYPVTSVAQSGIIGSIALCLPNFREGIVIPVCLTGIKAGIDGWLSVQKSYRDCLQEALDTGEMVGICDEIYSIYLCEFFWEQAMPLAQLVIPKIIESLLGQNVRGGGEYMSVQDAIDNTDGAVTYFTNYYGANVKDAFVGRAKEVIQNEICSVFISGVTPSSADLLDSLTEPESPAQYYGKFEETKLTTATTPALSHYKVFYHIYAGANAGAYYQVYLRGSTASSYYQDTSSSLTVASGYINVGSYADDTKDFTGVSGYDKLCISVNGVEECGFKSVTTNFAFDYAKDQYLAEQAGTTEIMTQSECVSGTTSLYNVLNLNIQAGAESLIDPAIYTRGIIRTCATASPGKGTDPNYDNQDARWIDVGYCDDEDLRCWIDTESVEDVIKAVDIENQTLTGLSEITIAALQAEGDYLSESEFSSVVKEIEEETDPNEKVNLINSIFENAFWSYQKAKLLLMKGDAYFDLFSILYAQYKPASTIPETTGTVGEYTEQGLVSTEGNVNSGVSANVVSYDSAISNVEVDSLDSSRENILAATKGLAGNLASRNTYDNCWDAAYQTYRNAKVGDVCAYSDDAGKIYTIANERCYPGNCKSATINTILYQEGKTFPTFAVYSGCLKPASKLDNLKTGDLISYVWNGTSGHNAIFIGWKDKTNEIAYLFDWNDWSDINNPKFRYYEEDLSDNMHPVYVYWSPVSNSETSAAEETISNLPTYSQKSLFVESETSTETSSESSTTSVSYKIFSEAVRYLNTKITSLAMTRLALSNSETGIQTTSDTGVTVANLNLLMNDLEANENFVEVNTGKLEVGDVVFLGSKCSIPLSVGIFGYPLENKNPYYTNLNGKITEGTTKNIFSVSSGDYIYKVYRYVGDREIKSVISRTIWDLNSAIEKIDSGLTGNYDDNKQFVDDLIFDGVLTKEQCEKILPTNVFGINLGGGMKISEIKNFLLVNQLEQVS